MTAPPLTKRNHYIPASIIGAFSRDPKGSLRESVVEWAMKGVGMKPPGTAECRFCRTDFYTLPRYHERWKTGLLLVTWNSVVKLDSEIKLHDDTVDADLEELADRYSQDGELRPDVVERMLAASIDGPFAEVAANLRAGGVPSQRDLDVCRSFLSVAYLRGPAWFFSPTAKAMMLQSMADGQRSIEEAGEYDASAWAHPLMVTQKEMLREISYLLALAVKVDEAAILDESRFAVELLIAKPGMGFILGDNAGRTYSSQEDPRSLSRVAFGIENPGSVITFPIGPRHCLRVAPRASGPRFQRIVVSGTEVRRINTALLTLANSSVVFPQGNVNVFMDGVSVAASPPWQEP